jgi:hypothetical protein
MSNWIKYTMVVLLVIALCAPALIATETNAQTCGYGTYGPSYGDYSYTATPMKAPAESLPATTTTAPVESLPTTTTPASENMSVSVPSQAAGYSTVSGKVAYNNGTLVPGAVVQLQSKYGAQYSTTSGADGHYEISNVIYDTYTFRYKKGNYESPSATLDVNTASIKRDISLPALLEGKSAAVPAAVDYSDIKNWYATRYTPQAPSNKAVIYGQSGNIERVLTGIPCQSY